MEGAARFSFSAGFEAMRSPLDVFEDETTIPRRKKRRSSARRVSFADTQTVHVFQRDDEYATPPGAVSALPQPEQAAGPDDSGSSTEKNAVAFVLTEDGEEAAGPVDINHIRDLSPEFSADDDITLDSTTFAAKFSKSPNNGDKAYKADDNFSFHNDAVGMNTKRSRSARSDMSFTIQNPRRPQASPGLSQPASVDRTMTMQYTEMVDAGTVAQRQRRVFRVSPHLKGDENASPQAPFSSPKKLKLECLSETKASSRRRPLQEISMINFRQEYEASYVRVEETASCCSKEFENTVSEASREEDTVKGFEFLLDTTDSHSEVSGRTTPVPTLGLLLDRDTCTLDTTFVGQPHVAEENTSPMPSESESRRMLESDKQRQEQVRWLQSKLALENDNSRRLECSKQLLLKKAEATRVCYETLKALHERSRQLNSSISKWNAANENQKELLLEQDIAALQKESQKMQEKVRSMKVTVSELDERLRELSSVSETCNFEQRKARLYQKMQGWHITRAISNGDFNRLDISYGYRVNQSITIEGKGPQTSVWMNLGPDVDLIEKGYPHMNSRLLFQALLPGEKLIIKQLKHLPRVMQQTSELVMNLIQVAKEAGDCRVRHRCLQSVVFLNSKDHGICILFSFENYKMRLKITLLFALQVLSSGEYPKDIVPYDVTVDSARRTMISEMDVSKAICLVPAGYQRFHRICECVDTFLP